LIVLATSLLGLPIFEILLMTLDVDRPSIMAVVGLALIVGGCGESYDGPAIQPVSGQVLVDGKPAAKALITFHALSGSQSQVRPFAETDADGSFRPSTYLTGDGAPVGEYILTIVWPEIAIDQGEEITGKDRLGGRYGNPQTSNLKVSVKEGENALCPFELRSFVGLPATETGP
jgi:hypothetical protein